MADSEEVGILLVEDDDGHALLVEKNLRRAGLSNGFLRLKDGQEALDYFFNSDGVPSKPGFDSIVVLLDVNMPRVSGVDVLKRLKESDVTANIPIIMLTTTDDPREIERCYDYGCNLYITKPVEYEAFIEAVRRLGFFLQIIKVPTAVRDGAFDLLVIDYQLDDNMSGLDFYNELREQGTHIPAVMCSGFSDDAHVSEALRCGIAHVLPKTQDYLDELSDLVTQILQQQTGASD